MPVAITEDMQSYIKSRSKEDLNGCWIWQLSQNGDGYGRFGRTANGNVWQSSAHRASYEAFVGPIPDGLYVCHSCDVRSCVNPDHLWLGSQKDNLQDMIVKNRRLAFIPQKVRKICKHCSNEFVGTKKSIFCASKCKMAFYYLEKKKIMGGVSFCVFS